MIKKYFLKGKELLNNKLEEYNINSSKMDFVAEQIPTRLKEPLSILQQEEIDIEDTQQYETYFKNYPNHHLSSFLLDKYNMMLAADAQPNPYQFPSNQQIHLPSFNPELERKALLLREVIEEYDEGYSKNDEPIVCICVINFHHKRGTEMEYKYPSNKNVESLENLVVHHAMPDSSHNKAEDYNFFNFEADFKDKKRMLFGVSYFKQIKLTEEMKKENSEFTRSYLQKAVAIVSTVPLFGYLKVKLCVTTKAFFEKFTNFEIIEAAYKELNKHLTDTWPTMPINNLFIGSDLKKIIPLFGAAEFYEIWKAVLYQKRIVVFAHSSSSASSFILSLMSLFPGFNTFGIYSKPIAKYMQSLRELALPLRLFNSTNFLSISFHIQDFHHLAKFKKTDKGNFLLGTTNRLLKESNDYGIELLVNLENCTIEKNKSRRPWESLHKKEKGFITELDEIVHTNANLGYNGSEDCIRDHFHNYLKGALVEIISGIKAFDKFVSECHEYEKEKSNSQTEAKPDGAIQDNFFPPLFPSETSKIIFPELLLQKSFAYFRQFKNENMPEIVNGKLIPSLLISNYDYLLRFEDDFISYNWIDKKLSFGKGVPKNFEGKEIRFNAENNEEGHDLTKSIYIGNVDQGKFSKSGVYIDEYDHYEGEFLCGVREGYGKLESGVHKYLGNFHNHLYDGQGQLIVGNDIYVGEFKEGLKNGYGTIQGETNLEGIWENDKFIQQKEIKTDEEKPTEVSEEEKSAQIVSPDETAEESKEVEESMEGNENWIGNKETKNGEKIGEEEVEKNELIIGNDGDKVNETE